MRAFYRTLRIISSITLFFFCWTFLPLYAAVAYAATPQRQGTVKQTIANNRSLTTGERFEMALEDIRANVAKTEEKTTKGEDTSNEIEALKAKKADIESIDTELKGEFAKTEKKLKDAKLTKEILDRHYKFIKHYEDHLSQLKTEINDIGAAKTGKEKNAKIQTIKAHLEAVKPPRKHVPLDPNKLPNRMVKAKERKPRLKKEDFEKEFPLQKKTTKLASLKANSIANEREWKQIASKSTPLLTSHSTPALLAYNDVASDVPFSLGVQRLNQQSEIHTPQWNVPQLAFADSAPLLLAQAVNLPTADDLAETPEVQFTQNIIDLASQLNNNPVKIYNWVRNNIEYAPTYGSIQGADQCLQSKICNDMDTASLLIALLRVSGIYAHYVYGTVDIPNDKAMNWVGGVTDPKMAGTIFATNGVPVTALISGGTIKNERIEHVWVKAYIDYIPSRGAVQKQGNNWIPLDASYKQYTYTQGIDIASAVPFDAQSIQIQSTINLDGSITNTNSPLIQQNIQNYLALVQNYIQQNYPNATTGDVIGQKEIIQQNYPILLGTLPYKTVQIGSEFATAPDSIRETMSFSIQDPTGATAGLLYNTGMAQIAGKKITLSFSPATTNDQAIIESLLPVPHADGTPIQASELPPSFPAYLINLVPELRIDGAVVATGTSATMGSSQSFNMLLNEPGVGVSNINNIVSVGDYIGIGLDTGRIGAVPINAIKSKLQTTITNLETQNFSAVTKDEVLGNLLYATIATYFAALDASNDSLAKATNVIRYKAPSVGMFSVTLNSQDVFGVAVNANPGGMMMDVDRIMQAVFSRDGSIDAVKQYMLTSGGVSSALEHLIPEQLYSTPNNPVQGVSAVKALQIAYDQGVPLYVVNQANINSVLPQLQISEVVKSDISNAVNAGKEVTVSKTNITYNGWNGCGYILIDPETGAGAYMISGGFNGFFERLLMDTILAILYVCVFAGIVEFAYLAAVVLGPIIFALENVIAAFIAKCLAGAFSSPYFPDFIKQIIDLPKRMASPIDLGRQLLKIAGLVILFCK